MLPICIEAIAAENTFLVLTATASVVRYHRHYVAPSAHRNDGADDKKELESPDEQKVWREHDNQRRHDPEA